MSEQSATPNLEASTPDDVVPSRAARRHQALAYQAIRHVRRALPLRELAHPELPRHHLDREAFPRWMIGRFAQIWGIWHESEMVQQGESDWPSSTLAHRLARAAPFDSAAGAQAALAFAYLLGQGIRPLDLMHAPGRDHAFVLIGRSDPLRARAETHEDRDRAGSLTTPEAARGELRPESWGADAVVCDPYAGIALRQAELMNTEYYFDYHPAESQLRAPVVQESAFDG